MQPEGLSTVQLGKLIESEPDEKDEAKPKKKKSKKKEPEEEEEVKEESPVEEEVITSPITPQPIKTKENPTVLTNLLDYLYLKTIHTPNFID